MLKKNTPFSLNNSCRHVIRQSIYCSAAEDWRLHWVTPIQVYGYFYYYWPSFLFECLQTSVVKLTLWVCWQLSTTGWSKMYKQMEQCCRFSLFFSPSVYPWFGSKPLSYQRWITLVVWACKISKPAFQSNPSKNRSHTLHKQANLQSLSSGRTI